MGEHRQGKMVRKAGIEPTPKKSRGIVTDRSYSIPVSPNTQIAPQEHFMFDHELARVVTVWADLPGSLKGAIMAIVDSFHSTNGIAK